MARGWLDWLVGPRPIQSETPITEEVPFGQLPTEETVPPSVLPRLGGVPDPEVRSLRGQLAIGDWRGTTTALSEAEGADRTWLVEKLIDWQGRPRWLDRWTDDQPLSGWPWLCSGAHHLTTSELGVAAGHLETALANDPSLDDARAWLLTATRGLGQPAAERDRIFGSLRAPLHRNAHLCMLGTLDTDRALAFARAASDAAPTGHGLHTLIADAHILRWLDLLTTDAAASKRYFQDPAVGDELRAAAERSVFSPDHEVNRRTPQDLNTWAFAFWLLPDADRARRLFDALEGHVTRVPWSYLDDPVQVYIAARNTTVTSNPP